MPIPRFNLPMRFESIAKRTETRSGSRSSLLIVSFHYLPERLVGVLRPARFARILPACGYDCSILTATPQPPGCSPNIRCVPWVRTFGETVIRKFFLPGEEAMSWAGKAAKAAAEMHAATPFSAVLVTVPPPPALRVGLILKKKFGLPLIADFRDPMRGSNTRLRYSFRLHDRLFEPLIFKNADAIIANTDAGAKLWRQSYPQWSKKIFTIWNGYDPEEKVNAAPLPRRDFRVLAHFGDVFNYRHPGALLASIARLIERGLLDPATLRIRFYGIVESLGDPEIAGRLVSRGVIETRPLMPFPEALRHMQESDYLLLVDFTDGAPGLQVPSKLYTYLRIGRPVLALTTPESPVARILRNSAVPHVCVFPGSPGERMDAQVLEFLRLPTDPVEPSAWFREKFDCISQTRALAGIIDRVCDTSSLR
jgi:glycosyltransferase involved in cell wall biosynthesis